MESAEKEGLFVIHRRKKPSSDWLEGRTNEDLLANHVSDFLNK